MSRQRCLLPVRHLLPVITIAGAGALCLLLPASHSAVAASEVTGEADSASAGHPSVQNNTSSGAAVADPAVARILAIDADSDYGEYLAGECLSCHQPRQAVGVPSIHGADDAHIVTELLRFKSGDRNNPTMVNVAKALGDEEMAALARYFSSL